MGTPDTSTLDLGGDLWTNGAFDEPSHAEFNAWYTSPAPDNNCEVLAREMARAFNDPPPSAAVLDRIYRDNRRFGQYCAQRVGGTRSSGTTSQHVCPRPPSNMTPATMPDEDAASRAQRIEDIMESMGASQTCRTNFRNDIDSDFSKLDTVMGCATPFGNIGPQGAMGLTTEQTDIRTRMESEGCVDILMNVNRQIISESNITCELNNTESNTDITVSTNNQIVVRGVSFSEAVINTIVGSAPAIPTPSPNVAIARLQERMYNTASAARTAAIDSLRSRISDSTFTVSSEVRVKSVSHLSNESKSRLSEIMKATAITEAESEIQRNIGFGSVDTSNLRQLVTNTVESNREAFVAMINNVTNNTSISDTGNNTISITFPGPFSIRGSEFNSQSQVNIASEALTTNSRTFGRSVAMTILAESLAVTGREDNLGGIDDVLDSIGAAHLALSRANSQGVANLMDALGGDSGMIILALIIGSIIFLLYFFRTAIDTVFPGPLKYVLAVVLIYFIVALFFGLWPFSSWPFGSSSEDSRVHVPMKVPSLGQSFGRSYPNVEYSRKNNVHDHDHVRAIPYTDNKVSARKRVSAYSYRR